MPITKVHLKLTGRGFSKCPPPRYMLQAGIRFSQCPPLTGRGFSKCPPPRYKLQAGDLVNAHHYGTHKVGLSKFPIKLVCPTRGDLANFTTNVST